MSWKSFACVAALSAIVATPALAAPSLTFTDNADGTGTFQIAPDAALLPAGGGSIAFEIEVDLTAGAFVSGTNGALFPTANPGDFDAGISSGVNIAGSTLTAAFGSDLFADGTAVDALTIDFGAAASFDYDAVVAQAGANNPFTGSGSVTLVTGLFGDFEPDGDVDIVDFGVFANAFGSVTGDANYVAAADSEPNGNVDIVDFGAFANNFGIGTATAVPEPTSAVLAMLALASLGLARRNG